MRRWIATVLAVWFVLSWYVASQPGKGRDQLAPALVVPFAVLAVACVAWAAWEWRRRRSAD